MNIRVNPRDSVWPPENPTVSKAPIKFSKRRWHSRNHLDIRPLLWSLRNRPEEWDQGEFELMHRPSKHAFWIANGLWFYGLRSTNGCNCKRVHEGDFTFIQKVQFHFARRVVTKVQRQKRQAERDAINKSFAEHFLP